MGDNDWLTENIVDYVAGAGVSRRPVDLERPTLEAGGPKRLGMGCAVIAAWVVLAILFTFVPILAALWLIVALALTGTWISRRLKAYPPRRG